MLKFRALGNFSCFVSSPTVCWTFRLQLKFAVRVVEFGWRFYLLWVSLFENHWNIDSGRIRKRFLLMLFHRELYKWAKRDFGFFSYFRINRRHCKHSMINIETDFHFSQLLSLISLKFQSIFLSFNLCKSSQSSHSIRIKSLIIWKLCLIYVTQNFANRPAINHFLKLPHIIGLIPYACQNIFL